MLGLNIDCQKTDCDKRQNVTKDCTVVLLFIGTWYYLFYGNFTNKLDLILFR